MSIPRRALPALVLPLALAVGACGLWDDLTKPGDKDGKASESEGPKRAHAETVTADHDGMLAPVHLDGDKFVDDQGKAVAIHGVNFFGFNTPNNTLHGLWGSDPIGADFQTIVWRQKLLGFNAVRLPFSFKSFAGTPQATAKPCDLNVAAQVKATTADPQDNPALVTDPPALAHTVDGKGQCNGYLPTSSSRDQYLWVVDFYVRNGFYVLVDNHSEDRTIVENADQWAQSWAALIGDIMAKDGAKGRVFADILNEPDQVGGRWADGSVNMGTLYLKAMDAIWAKSQDIIFFVEGMAQGSAGANWGDGFCHDDAAMQQGASDPRGFLDALAGKPYAKHAVLSPHVYGPTVTHKGDGYKDKELYDRLDRSFGSKTKGAYKNFVLPVCIGEFGSKFEETEDIAAMQSIAKYLAGTDGSSAHNPIPHWFYWDWNADSGDTGGIVADDWKTLQWPKLRFLRQNLGLTPWYGTKVVSGVSGQPAPGAQAPRASQAPLPGEKKDAPASAAPSAPPDAAVTPTAPVSKNLPPAGGVPLPAVPSALTNPAPTAAASTSKLPDLPPVTSPGAPIPIESIPVSPPTESGPQIAGSSSAALEADVIVGSAWKDNQGRWLASLNLVIHAPATGVVKTPWKLELTSKDFLGVNTSWGLTETTFKNGTLFATGQQHWQSMGGGESSAVNIGAIMVQKQEHPENMRLIINGAFVKLTFH